MLFVDKEDYLTDFEKKTRDDDYLDHYLKNPNAPGIVQVKLELRQLFYDFWFKDGDMEAKILEKLNENNVWILIDFFRERISKYFDDSKNGLECARLSTLMEKLYKKAFEYYKKGKVDPDDFENLANSFKNHFTLKIFFQGLLSELKRAEDKLSDNFSFYFGAFFNFLKEAFQEDASLLHIFKTNFIDPMILDYQYAKKFDSIRYVFFNTKDSEESGTTGKKGGSSNSLSGLNGKEEVSKSKREKYLNQLSQMFKNLYNLVKDEVFFYELQKFLKEFFLNKYKFDISAEDKKVDTEGKGKRKKLGGKKGKEEKVEESGEETDDKSKKGNKCMLNRKRGRPNEKNKIKSEESNEEENLKEENSNNEEEKIINRPERRRKISKAEEELMESIMKKRKVGLRPKNKKSPGKKSVTKVAAKVKVEDEIGEDELIENVGGRKKANKVHKPKNAPSKTETPKNSAKKAKVESKSKSPVRTSKRLEPSTTPRTNRHEEEVVANIRKPLKKVAKNLNMSASAATPIKTRGRKITTPLKSPTTSKNNIRRPASSSTKKFKNLLNSIDSNNTSNFTLGDMGNSVSRRSSFNRDSDSNRKISAEKPASSAKSKGKISGSNSFSKNLKKLKEKSMKSPSKFNITPLKKNKSKSPNKKEEDIVNEVVIASPRWKSPRRSPGKKAKPVSTAKKQRITRSNDTKNAASAGKENSRMLGKKRIRFNYKESVTEFDPNTPVKTLSGSSKKVASAARKKSNLTQKSPKPKAPLANIVINRRQKRHVNIKKNK